MPEGDTVHRAARTLERALAGDVVTRFETRYAHLATVHDDRPLTGRTIEAVTSRGKHLLMRFSGDLVLRTHMRMSGSWHLYRAGEPWRRPGGRARIVVGTPAFVAVAFDVVDARFYTSSELERDETLRALGPDLLGDAFDQAEAERRLRARVGWPIGEALLDQRVVAGVGNVFKSETLFVCGVNPFSAVESLRDEQIGGLIRSARELLAMNVREDSGDGIVTVRGLRRTMRRLDPRDRLWVYDRRGKPCRQCGTPIAYRKQGIEARPTFWCPRCQPEPGETVSSAGERSR